MAIFIDKENKKLLIEKLPKEEVNIIPDLKFYDVQASTFANFTKDDINKVQEDAKDKIEQQIDQSNLQVQARERLLENLSSVINLTQAIGWTVEDKTNELDKVLINISK
jgi:signal recognition particle GTPase